MIILQEVEPSCNPEILFAENLLLAHTEELSFDASTLPRETIKQIDAALNEEGDITIATSSKLSNIRFKLGDFLLETASAVITMTTSIQMPVKFVITSFKIFTKNPPT